MGFETFFLLVIAIAVGVGLGTGKLSVDSLFLFLWVNFVGMLKIAFWLLVFFASFFVSYWILSYLSIFWIVKSEFEFLKTILIWVFSFCFGVGGLVLAIYIKEYGLKEGLRQTWEGSNEEKTRLATETALVVEHDNKIKAIINKNKVLKSMRRQILIWAWISVISIFGWPVIGYLVYGGSYPPDFITIVFLVADFVSCFLFFYFSIKARKILNKELKVQKLK